MLKKIQQWNPTVDADAEADVDMGDEPADDTAVDVATAGGEEEAGPETRESVERSRKLGTIPQKKKKKKISEAPDSRTTCSSAVLPRKKKLLTQWMNLTS